MLLHDTTICISFFSLKKLLKSKINSILKMALDILRAVEFKAGVSDARGSTPGHPRGPFDSLLRAASCVVLQRLCTFDKFEKFDGKCNRWLSFK